MDEQTIKNAINKINERLDELEKRHLETLDTLIEYVKAGGRTHEH